MKLYFKKGMHNFAFIGTPVNKTHAQAKVAYFRALNKYSTHISNTVFNINSYKVLDLGNSELLAQIINLASSLDEARAKIRFAMYSYLNCGAKLITDISLLKNKVRKADYYLLNHSNDYVGVIDFLTFKDNVNDLYFTGIFKDSKLRIINEELCKPDRTSRFVELTEAEANSLKKLINKQYFESQDQLNDLFEVLIKFI